MAMANERLEALIGEFADIEREQQQLNARKEFIEFKLNDYYPCGAQVHQHTTVDGTLVRAEVVEKFLEPEAAPAVLEALRDQVYNYFRVSVLMYPNAECLKLASNAKNPLYHLLRDKLIVTRRAAYKFIPASVTRPLSTGGF